MTDDEMRAMLAGFALAGLMANGRHARNDDFPITLRALQHADLLLFELRNRPIPEFYNPSTKEHAK